MNNKSENAVWAGENRKQDNQFPSHFMLQPWKKITKTGNACRYIPDATGAVYEVLKQMTEEHTTKRKRYGEEDTVMLNKVSKHIITKETLKEKLAEHVEQVFFFFLHQSLLMISFYCIITIVILAESLWWFQVDYEMALEYATQSGVSEEPRENIYLQHLDPNKSNFIDLHSPNFVFRLML